MDMEKKSKKILMGVLLLLTSIAAILIYSKDNIQLMYLGGYAFVIKGDKDNVYERLLLVERTIPEKEFNELLDTLLNKNHPDLLTMEAAIRYVKENHLTAQKAKLVSIQDHFESIRRDSVWEFKYDEGKYRSNYLENAHIVPYLSSAISELE